MHIKRKKNFLGARGVDEEVSAELPDVDLDIVDDALVDALLGDSDGEDWGAADLPIEYQWRRAKQPQVQASGPASGSLRGALRGASAGVSVGGSGSVGRFGGGTIQFGGGESPSASGPSSLSGSVGRKVSWGKVHVRGAAPTLPAAFLQPKPVNASVTVERQNSAGHKNATSDEK